MFPTEFFRCAGVARIYSRDSSESVNKEEETGDRGSMVINACLPAGGLISGNTKRERKTVTERSEYRQEDFLRG